MGIFSKVRNLPVMKRAMKKLVEAKSTTQDAYDMYNLAVLFKCYEWHHQQQSHGRIAYEDKISGDKVHELEEALKLGNYYDDISYCQNAATAQVGSAVCLLLCMV
jgi:hypothetical protein